MARKCVRKAPKNNWRPPRRKAAPFGSYQAVRLDIVAVKNELLQRWKAAERDFARQQQEWETYCREEQPAYEKWQQMTFGERIAELKELQEAFRMKEWFVQQVRNISFVSVADAARVYAKLRTIATENGLTMHEALSRHIAELQEQERQKREAAAEQRRAAGNNRGDNRDSFSRFMQDFINEFRRGFGDFDEDDDDFEEADDFDDDDFAGGDFRREFEDIFNHARRPPAVTPEAKNFQARIKDVYRKLCFRLHPDTGCDFNAENSRLWHQIQEAYQHEDLDSLLAIQAGLDMKQDPMASHISCSQILDVVREFTEGTSSTLSLVRKAKRSPAWRFSRWTEKKRQTVSQRLASQYAREISELRQKTECLELIENEWKIAGEQEEVWRQMAAERQHKKLTPRKPAAPRKKPAPPPASGDCIQPDFGF